jgi:hypothetical protein
MLKLLIRQQEGNIDVTNINTDFDNYLAKSFPWPKTPAERMRIFKRAEPETRAAIERAYNTRENFGCWDGYDPVANAIIDLATAQNLVTAAINEDAETGGGEITPFAVARVRAIINLIDALTEAIAERITGAAELYPNVLTELASELAVSVNRFNDVIDN